MVKNGDCAMVASCTRLRGLKRWKRNGNGSVPFYLCTGKGEGVVFSGKPEIARQLLKTYNQQKLCFQIDLASFLSSEGLVACNVSAPVDDVLGYHTELSNN